MSVASTMSWIKISMPEPQRVTPAVSSRSRTGSDVMRKPARVRQQRRAKNKTARASRRRNRD